jgi:hypothetical protein
MGSPVHYACYGKEMLGWIHEKMATQESALGGAKFFASSSTAIGNDALACNDLCTLYEDYSIVARNESWDNTHTSDLSSRGERLDEKPNTLVQCAQCIGGSSNG